MAYEPHTERIGPDETLDLPPDAVGITVDRDGECYVVQYLAPTEATRETRREDLREIHSNIGTTEPNVEIDG